MARGGARPNSGPKKGSKHKQTVAVKQCVLNAFEHIGGVQNLVKWAKENETEFYTKMWIKILPNEISGPDGERLQITIKKVVHEPTLIGGEEAPIEVTALGDDGS